MNRTLPWCLGTAIAACASIDSPTAAEAARLDEARQLLAQRTDEALVITDQLLRENPDCWPARLIAGEGSLRLSRSGRGRPDILLEDAVTNFEKGLADLPKDREPGARRMLAECYHDLERFELGSATARASAEGFATENTAAGRRGTAESLLVAGRCDMQRFVAARKAEIGTSNDVRVPPGDDTAQLAALAAAEFDGARSQFPAEASMRIASIHQWLGQDHAAVIELERGVRSAPTEPAVHDAYIGLLDSIGQADALTGAYARFVREMPDQPMIVWFQAYVHETHGDRLRQQGNFQRAVTAYEKAHRLYGECKVTMPHFTDDARKRIARCDLAISSAAVETGDARTAAAHVLAAIDASPATTEYADDGSPGVRDNFQVHFTAAVFAVHRCLAESGTDALSRTLEFNEAVAAKCPDRFGFVYNNAGLAARDLGVQKANAGDDAAAKELWERAYRHYEKATALLANDARTANDCGLMLVYHLRRDLPRARELFDRAITIGEAQLAALPADADASQREQLEEAVGDAWQNIAILLRDLQNEPFDAWRPFCEKSVRFFPYQRREAAKLLRESAAPSVGSSPSDASSGTPQGNAAEALAKVQKGIDEKVAGGDLDGALALLDQVAKDCRDHAPYHRLRGDLTLKFARQSRDSGRKGTALHYQDAVIALQRAVELDAESAATRQQLGEAQLEAEEPAAAAATASSLLLHLQSQGGGKPEEVLAAHTLRATAAARAYGRKKAAKEDDKELLSQARASFRFVEEKGSLDAEQRTLWSNTELWASAPAEAVNVHARALKKSPDDQAALKAVVDLANANKQMPLAVELLQGRTDATGLWYLGWARFLLACEQSQAQQTAEAQKTLDASKLAFETSMQKNGDYRESCEQWIAMCLGKKGNVALQANDLANAETWLMESLKRRPDRLAENLGGGNESTKLGVMTLADKFFKKRDLAKVEAIYRAASDAANSDSDLLNNAGLFARDHGNELEAAGKAKEAMGMYEQSYKAYRRAQQLDPQNVRLRNDCALIAIYHLDRDWDLAKELLDSAIADGEKTLRDNPPEHPDDKQQLDEAVGDCYENLALWHLKHGKDGAAAKAAAEQSQKHWPGERRPGARRHLQAAERLLKGK